MNRSSIILMLSFLLGACTSSRPPAPVEDLSVSLSRRTKVVRHVADMQQKKGQTYVVKPGDTLYQIALNHGVSHRDLMAWNSLPDTNKIQTGQTLRLSMPEETQEVEIKPFVEPGRTSSKSTGSADLSVETKTYPKTWPPSHHEQTASSMEAKAESATTKLRSGTEARSSLEESPTQSADKSGIDWIWPTKGTPSNHFSESNKGIDIPGKEGQAIFSIAAGKVSYVGKVLQAGNGLSEYGNLIIIKHNKEFLSVYAHNKKIFVKEGDFVEKGEQIAEMGSSGTDQVKLHLEIRRFGKPVDPYKYILAE